MPNWFGGGSGPISAASDSSGVLWVLYWSRDYDYAPPQFFLRRSTDGAKSFSVIDIDGGIWGTRDARLAVNASGDVFVLWRKLGLPCLTHFPHGDEKQRKDSIISDDASHMDYFDLALDAKGLPVCVWSGELVTDLSARFLTCIGSSDPAHLLDKILWTDTLAANVDNLSLACDRRGSVFVLYSALPDSGGSSMLLARTDRLGNQSFQPVPLESPYSSPLLCVDSLGGVNVISNGRHFRSSDEGKTFVELARTPGPITALSAGPGGELYAICEVAGLGSAFCRRTASGSYSSFYPLQLGNFWNYQVDVDPQTSYHRSYRERPTVVGDTLMPNGLQYWHLSPKDPFGGEFVRVDSGYVHYYKSGSGVDVKVFRVQGQGTSIDTINWERGLFSVFADNVATWKILGKTTAVRNYHAGGLTMFNLALADSFGIVTAQDLADGAWPYYERWDLIGASIGGVTYGVLDEVRSPEPSPSTFTLGQNYPNPFNPTTTIRYILPHRAHVSLTVFNLLGQKVIDLVDGEAESGSHEVTFNATSLASGVYLYRLSATPLGWRDLVPGSTRDGQAGGTVLVRSMILVK